MKLYLSLYDRLKSQHETIEQVIMKVNSEGLNFRPEPNKWSIHDNIAHLAKYQPVFTDRINKILNTDLPSFERYTAENDPDFETWRQWSIEKLMQTLYIDRQNIFQLITNLSEKESDRIGQHPTLGKLKVVQWTEFFLLHEAHHIFTIFRLANRV